MKCFVIMPYGKTENEQKAYMRTYKLLIKSAVEECGLTCVRSDIEARGGQIISNVIEDLADDDIVVADLSGLNWNVAYELGIRHVLRKNGTILICDNATELPFDIQSMNIFIYPVDWLDEMEEQADKLAKIISNRMNGVTKADSPIHEKYPFLPDDVVKAYNSPSDAELIKAKEKIAALENELAGVYEQIDRMGLTLSSDSSAEINYEKQFLNDLNNSIYNSDAAVQKLRELLDEGDKEGFLSFLAKVLNVGYLDEVDCKIISGLCDKLEIPNVSRTFLEAVTKFYPDNEELAGYLANEYSLNYHTREKALSMVNGILGVIKKDGSFMLAKNVRATTNKLASFFDVYLHLKRYDDLLEIGYLLLERYENTPKILDITLRNMIHSHIYSDSPKEAIPLAEKLLELSPESDLTHYAIYKLNDALEDYASALESLELCISIDPKDLDYYFIMAAAILDNRVARDPDTNEIVKVDSIHTDEFAVPFVIAALNIDSHCINRALDFLRRNDLSAYCSPITDVYQSGSGNYIGAFDNLNFGAVRYALNLGVDEED